MANGFLAEVPNHFFYIWLGMVDGNRLSYPYVWRELGVSPVIYYDSRAYLSGLYKTELYNIAKQNNKNIVEIQNSFYELFLSKGNVSFDEVFIEFLSENKCSQKTVKKYKEILSRYTKKILDNNFNFVDINSLDILFYKEGIQTLYIYEVVLRNNLAAASDILRLLLLYKFGGVYSDFDTLPDFDYIFTLTNNKVKKENGINYNLVDIVRTEKLLDKIRPGHINNHSEIERKYYDLCLSYIRSEYPDILLLINADIAAWDGRLKPFIFPDAYIHTGKISASKNNPAEYNNNMLISHAGSKGIRILFIEMIRRYSYIKKHGYLFSFKNFGKVNQKTCHYKKNEYYERLNTYRLDGTDKSNNVTLILSGPSFILEVILGLSYSTLSINDNISPLTISYALREKTIGIGFESQTMFTLEHVQSSWM